MSDDPDSFSALLDRVLQGDEQATRQLFDQALKPLIRVIRRRLPPRSPLRKEFESTDFVQEAWARVLADPEALRDFGTFNDFMKLLVRQANHRIDHARRMYLDAQKRDLRREYSLSDPDIAFLAALRADPQSDPVARLAFYETWDRWLRSLSKHHKIVACLLRDGSTYSEIAEQIGCSERTIERMVADLRATFPPERSR